MANHEKKTVIDFLDRCVAYANDSIARKKERGDNEVEIGKWETYRDFTAYASEEIARGDLDDWFESKNFVDFDLSSGIDSVEIDEMIHRERSRWLSAIISPRPLVLVSTLSADGIPNLAPMSSVSVISNTPPLLGMSLSTNRDGRPRDTLLNLKETGKAVLSILPANSESAEIVSMTAKPIPKEESEWNELEAINSTSETVSAPKIAIAAIETTLLECHKLPLGAVAEWVVLKVDSIITPSNINLERIEDALILSQVSDDSFGGIQTTDWVTNSN